MVTEWAMNPLTRYRNANRLNITQLAELLKTSKANVSRWEAGTRKPSPKAAMKIEVLTKGKVKRVHLRPDVYGAAQ